MTAFSGQPIQFLNQVVNGIPDMIYVLDLENGAIDFLNDRVADLLGRAGKRNGAEKKPQFGDLVHPDDVPMYDRHLAACSRLQDGETKDISLRLQVKDNTYRLFTLRDVVFKRKENGSVSHITGIIRDTIAKDTDEPGQEANQLLFKKNRQLQAVNAELKTFNTLLVQDYQQTLRQVYTSLELIIGAEARHFSNTSRAHLRRMQSVLQRLNLLTNDIVSYSGIQAEENSLTSIDLKEVVKTVMNDLGERMVNVNATIHFEALPSIDGYPQLVTVLFHHLLLNALKFKKEDRTPVITIGCERLRGADMEHTDADPSQSYYLISVRDNGSGFDPAEKEKIFDLFYQAHNTAKFRGTGTGLAIAKKIMTLHGGFIEAVSKPGEWAEFCCYFPVEN